jgi:hypothetical protein
MRFLGLLSLILDFFAVRKLHVGVNLDHPATFLLLSALFWASRFTEVTSI